jgi:hypothetical protein
VFPPWQATQLCTTYSSNCVYCSPCKQGHSPLAGVEVDAAGLAEAGGADGLYGHVVCCHYQGFVPLEANGLQGRQGMEGAGDKWQAECWGAGNSSIQGRRQAGQGGRAADRQTNRQPDRALSPCQGTLHPPAAATPAASSLPAEQLAW